jgi:D-lactate dehydrogenase (cytochrome)
MYVFSETTQSDSIASPADPYENLLTDLRTALRENQIETDIEECKLRAKPWSSYHRLDIYPRAIVFPETTADVSTILKFCHKHRIPVVPFGGGTSIEGQTLTPYSGISVDFSNMKKIIDFNEEDMDITVQAGLGYIELNEQLKELCKKSPLWFPLDPGPSAFSTLPRSLH